MSAEIVAAGVWIGKSSAPAAAHHRNEKTPPSPTAWTRQGTTAPDQEDTQ